MCVELYWPKYSHQACSILLLHIISCFFPGNSSIIKLLAFNFILVALCSIDDKGYSLRNAELGKLFTVQGYKTKIETSTCFTLK